jgi:hypothetical protein
MPLQNRVTPEGKIVATPHRGLMYGNRGGPFHRPDKTLKSRHWHSRLWIACRLQFKGRHRAAMMQPNRYTELFFLDEATALSAGHRPCFECRRQDAEAFARLWAQAQGLARPPRAPEMDDVLHAERIGMRGEKITFRARLADLPDGAFVRHAAEDGSARACLVIGNHLLPWSHAGYSALVPAPVKSEALEVLTPRSIVAVLGTGYRPMLHPTATALLGPGFQRGGRAP